MKESTHKMTIHNGCVKIQEVKKISEQYVPAELSDLYDISGIKEGMAFLKLLVNLGKRILSYVQLLVDILLQVIWADIRPFEMYNRRAYELADEYRGIVGSLSGHKIGNLIAGISLGADYVGITSIRNIYEYIKSGKPLLRPLIPSSAGTSYYRDSMMRKINDYLYLRGIGGGTSVKLNKAWGREDERRYRRAMQDFMKRSSGKGR